MAALDLSCHYYYFCGGGEMVNEGIGADFILVTFNTTVASHSANGIIHPPIIHVKLVFLSCSAEYYLP